MKQFGLFTIYEVQKLLRNRLIWLISLLTVGAMAFPSLEVLLLQLLVIQAINYHKDQEFFPIMQALPYSALALTAARALAILCLFLLLWPFMLVIAAFFPDMVLAEWLQNGGALLLLTVKYVVMCSDAIGFIFLLTTILGRSPWFLYVASGSYWALGLCIAGNLTYLPHFAWFFLWGYGFLLPSAPSAMIGFGLEDNILLGFAVCQLSLAILSVLLTAAWRMWRHGEALTKQKLAPVLFILAALIGISSGFFVLQEFDQRESDFRRAIAETEVDSADVAKGAQNGAAAAKLDRYRLNVQLHTAAQSMTATAYMELTIPDFDTEVFPFTLRSCFTVRNVTSAEGLPLAWSREGSRLWIEIPKETRKSGKLSLVISYGGRVNEWFDDRLARPYGVVNLISERFSLLRSGFAWYPLPGDHSLYLRKSYRNPWNGQTKTTLWAKPLMHRPVPFELTVDTDSHDTVVTNLNPVMEETLTGSMNKRYHFYSKTGKNVFLITGPYRYERQELSGHPGWIDTYTYRRHGAQTAPVLQAITEPYWFYENRMRETTQETTDRFCTLVEMPNTFYSSIDGRSLKDLVLDGAVLIAENDFSAGKSVDFLQAIQANKQDIAVLQHWWQENICGETEGMHGANIPEAIMLYIYALHNEKLHPGQFYEPVKENLLAEKSTDTVADAFTRPFLIGGSLTRDVFMTLDWLHRQDDGLLKKVTLRLYQTYQREHSLTADQFSQVVLAETEHAGWSRQQRDEFQTLLAGVERDAADEERQEMISPTSLTIFAFNMEEWLP